MKPTREAWSRTARFFVSLPSRIVEKSQRAAKFLKNIFGKNTGAWAPGDDTISSLAVKKSIDRHVSAALTLVVLLGVGVGGWAVTTKLAGAVISPGYVVVASSAKKIQHEFGGTVAELRAREGDHVEAGQLLIRLDETQARATFNMMTKELDNLSAQQARLEAEQNDEQTIPFPSSLTSRGEDPDVAHAIAGETRLFDLRRAARAGLKAQLTDRVDQLNREIDGLVAQTASNEKQSSLIQDELGAVRSLWEKHLVDLTRVKALEREAARLSGEHGQLIAASAEAKGKIAETELQIIQVDQNARSEVGKDLADVRARLNEFTERQVAAEDQLKHVDIVSPQGGKVAKLSVHVAGEVITPREPIMMIVPDNDDLVVESKIAPQDRDRLYQGQNAELRFSSANQRSTPEIRGTVTLISADLIQDERTGANYYKVQVRPDRAELARLRGVDMVPGMPVETYIQTSERTAFSYLMKPLSDRVSKAFRED
jgi:HlyD family secretion protein